MIIKYYVSSTSGNKEMKRRQMKAQLLLESKGVHFQVIDISDPGSQEEKVYMQKNAVAKVGARNAIPPQFFNSVEGYCGDYEGFDEAIETDTVEEFLKLPKGSLPQVPIIFHSLSNTSSREVSLEPEKEVVSVDEPPKLNGHNEVEEPAVEDLDEHIEEPVVEPEPVVEEVTVEEEEEEEEEDGEAEVN